MLDELIESFKRRMEPRWDQLRERRVLGEIERGIEQRMAHRSVQRRVFAIAIPLSLSAAALVVAYIVGVDFGKRTATTALDTGPHVGTAANQTAPKSAAPGNVVEARVMGDGSRLELSHSAKLEVRSDSKNRVELAQTEGRVHYQVTHIPGRAFVVMARGVQVQVKGTVFVVDIESGKVNVSVEQGRVRVAASSGEVELGVGDELSTPVDQEASTDTGSDTLPPVDSAAPRSRTPRGDLAPSTTANALLDRADAERRSGDLSAAANTLRELVGRYPSDRRAALAWFTLGKVERARDRAAAAAKAFETSFALAPDGSVAEDALAEEAVAWAAANNPAAARAAAELYSRRFPEGTHAARMQRILE